MTELD
jgi:beta-glucosidase